MLAGIPPVTPAEAAGSFIVYDSTGRTGASLDLVGGTSYPDLGLINFDNAISSISVSGREMVSLYTEPNFSGTCVTPIASEDNFATLNVGDNTISSIRTNEGCCGPSSAYVRLHHHSSAYVTGTTIYENTPDLRPLGANDEASEITLYNVNAATVNSDINYGGRCETIIPLNQGSLTGIATDAAGNEQRITISPINIDTTKPTITVSDIVQEATGPDGAAVSFTPSTLDATSGIDSTTCADANTTTVVSRGAFALGTTLVTCTTTDLAGNSQSASFSILVRDTTAPVVTTPDAIEVNATGPRGAIVTFSTSATDVVTADLRVTCTPLESGRVFRVGTTDVTCRATDANGNTGEADFPVTVVVVSACDVLAVDLAWVGSKRRLWLVTSGEERLSMSEANRVCRDAGLESAIGIECYRYQGEWYTRVTCAGAASLAR